MMVGPRLPRSSRTEPIEFLRKELNEAIRGKAEIIELVLACLLARGHLLLEDLPGLGKTTLAKCLAKAVGGQYARVQCTPDLLPGDISGFSVFNQKTREFDFVPGPVFANVLLADEINRTTPRTQSALLEAMAERQVTVDNVRHSLSASFFVIATQNPVEHHGTYPLPEAQLDRFAMKLSLGYPGREDEMALLAEAIGDLSRDTVAKTSLLEDELNRLQVEVAQVAVEPKVRTYLVDLGRETRTDARISLGLSPRGLLIWQRVAQAIAYLGGRDFVVPDDIQRVAEPVLGVRLGLSPGAVKAIVESLLHKVPVPV